jgi:glutathione S-transferase
MSDPDITFYRLQACPFCERVTRVLKDLDLEYRSRFVEARHSRRDAVKRLTGSRTVPAIVDENTGVTMGESANIVRYLRKTYGSEDVDPAHVTASAAGGGDE